mmetsp:Transcript_13607/g.33436  ORF Transcript_13607/g.33436 Transcript_13607/m.33436 type:complete len:209 (+) Transcript_13607:1023-1649(+)
MACRKADSDSMTMSTPSVAHANTKKPMKMAPMLFIDMAIMSTRSKNTEDSWECASDSAHSRRYDAVLDTAPRMNSMVWIIWCTMISPKSKWSPWPWPPSWPPAPCAGAGAGAWPSSSSWLKVPCAISTAPRSRCICSWRFFRIRGLGSSMVGTMMKAMSSRNTCRPPWPLNTRPWSSMEPGDRNMLIITWYRSAVEPVHHLATIRMLR